MTNPDYETAKRKALELSRIAPDVTGELLSLLADPAVRELFFRDLAAGEEVTIDNAHSDQPFDPAPLPTPVPVLPVVPASSREWADGDAEPLLAPVPLPPPPPLPADAQPAHRMRHRFWGDGERYVSSSRVLQLILGDLRASHPLTAHAEILPWLEYNEDGEYFTSDDTMEASLVLPDRRARLVIWSSEIARKSQAWLAVRLENGVVIKGFANAETWARLAAALAVAPPASPLPPSPQSLREVKHDEEGVLIGPRSPDRFRRPYVYDRGDGWA